MRETVMKLLVTVAVTPVENMTVQEPREMCRLEGDCVSERCWPESARLSFIIRARYDRPASVRPEVFVNLPSEGGRSDLLKYERLVFAGVANALAQFLNKSWWVGLSRADLPAWALIQVQDVDSGERLSFKLHPYELPKVEQLD